MTVLTTEAYIFFDGNGVTTEFTFPMTTYKAEWIYGLIDRAAAAGSAVLNADQEINPGGVFTFDTPPPDGSEVTIVRFADFLQETEYPPFSRFPAKDHEEALDKLTMLTQQLGYSILLLEGDASLYVRRAGDTMVGDLLIPTTTGTTPAAAAVQKGYVDTAITDLDISSKADITYVDAQDDALSLRISNNEAALGTKADKTIRILSGDTDTIGITNPALDTDVTITSRTNVSNGLVKIGSAGLIPPELLPPIVGGALYLIGLFDAGPGVNPPPPDDSTTRSGGSYLVSDPGTLLLYRVETQVQENVAVNEGDALVWIAPNNNPGAPSGWYYLGLTQLPRQAITILMDDTALPYTAGNVQEGFDSLAVYMQDIYLQQFGMGALTGSGAQLPNNDANTIAVAGVFAAGTAWTGSPYGGTNSANQGQLYAQYYNVNNATQIWHRITGNELKIRYKNSGVWQPWVDVWTTANIASQAEAETGTDNTKGMTPLRTAQRMAKYGFQDTGYFTSVVDLDAVSLTNGRQPYLTNTGSSNTPTDAYYYIDQYVYSSGNRLQIAYPYRVTSEGFYMRSYYGGTWSSWMQMWTSNTIATKAEADAGTDNTKGITSLRSRQGLEAYLAGTPVASTATAGTNTTQIATTEFVTTAVSGKADSGHVHSAADITTGTLAVTRGGTGVTTSTGTGSVVLSASPTFTGNPVATTQTAGNNSTRIATTAFVSTAITGKADTVHTHSADDITSGTLGVANGGTGTTTSTGTGNVVLSVSPALTGVPTAPTQISTDDSTRIATTAFVTTAVAGKADTSHVHSAADITTGTLAVARGGTGVATSTGTGSVVLSASPTFTGNPIATTQISTDNSTRIATTAYVTTAVAAKANTSHTHSAADITTGTLAVARGGTGVATSTGTGSVVLSASPTFTGAPLSTTPTAGDNTTKIATTAFVTTAVAAKANTSHTHSAADITSGTLAVARGGTGTTTSTGTGSNVLSASPALTGSPTATSLSISGTLSVVGEISSNADVVAFASDGRLKRDVVVIENALSSLSHLRGVKYKFNSLAESYGFDSTRDHIGLIAQEVETVYPEIIKLAPFDSKDGVSVSGENYKTIQYDKVVSILVEAVKELNDKVKQLESTNKVEDAVDSDPLIEQLRSIKVKELNKKFNDITCTTLPYDYAIETMEMFGIPPKPTLKQKRYYANISVMEGELSRLNAMDDIDSIASYDVCSPDWVK